MQDDRWHGSEDHPAPVTDFERWEDELDTTGPSTGRVTRWLWWLLLASGNLALWTFIVFICVAIKGMI